MAFNIITFLCILILFTSPLRFWFQSKGQLWITYRLDLFVFTCYTILETYLALTNPSQIALLLMNLINVWALICAVKGILRLKREEKDAKNKNEKF